MTSFPNIHVRSPLRRRILCGGTIAVLTWGSLGIPASTAPSQAFETPVMSAAFTGLTVGSQGADVRALQQALLDAGIAVRGGADGVFGPGTRQAVLDFQESQGLPATGEVDEATAAALAADTTDAGDEEATPDREDDVGVSTLALGARGPAVVALQNTLIESGVYLPDGADGVFGASTDRAVAQFQRSNGLAPTGAVDQATASRLEAAGGRIAPDFSPGLASPYLGLAEGAEGDLVTDTQLALIAAGVPISDGANGTFGDATRAALQTYQRAFGIEVDGIVNQETINMLGLGSNRAPWQVPGAGGSSTQPPAQNNPYVGLTVGATGPLVRELQTALQNTGLVVRGGADGVFGSATRTALIEFQSANGIPRTGVVTLIGAGILRLGSGSVGITNPNTNDGGDIRMERFPVQGRCFFGDTWHAARGGGRLHVGVDIIADEGKLLYAVVDGEVSRMYQDQPGALAGNGLRIAQPNGTYFTYLHMHSFAPGIELGTQVEAGDVIGYVGNTGSSSTAHLHFEIHPNGGDAINPYPLVEAMDDCSNTTPRYQSSFS